MSFKSGFLTRYHAYRAEAWENFESDAHEYPVQALLARPVAWALVPVFSGADAFRETVVRLENDRRERRGRPRLDYGSPRYQQEQLAAKIAENCGRRP